ncbi:hypothetical protein [Mycobacterium tilburgii]|uniref:hypothetical protein n=1 Tax=Mycobacterium tilburgii TaxID=44467 RepID=UPI0016423D64|nr:hypothetical protein [Mycobacterium tilburgii]
MKWVSVNRVRNTEPAALSRCRSTGGTGPLAVPNNENDFVPTLFGVAPRDTVALVFVGGEQSHSFTATRAVEPEFESWDVGHAAIAAAADRVGIRAGELLYARVDVTAADPVRVGVDVVAPSLGWRLLDNGARDLASALVRVRSGVSLRAARAGPGPASMPIAPRWPP